MPGLDSHPPIWVEHATRQFGNVVAVNDVSLSVPAGTIVGVIGPSGSGKTTLLRMITGMLEPTQGSVRVLGEDPHHFRRQTREQIGYMPQQFVLYPELTAEENVEFMGALFGLMWRGRHRRVREVLQFLELWDVRKRRARDLSGGMQRRLELACALVHGPRLFLVDEPTAGLDPLLRQKIWEEFRRLRDEGRTLLVTTQYVGEAEYCDMVTLLVEGHILAHANPEDLRREALGGDVIQLETAGAFDGQVLTTVAGVISVRQSSARGMLIVVENAGAATPRLQEAISSTGMTVQSISEHRPSFDEVFTELVTRNERQRSSVAPPQEDGVVSRVA